MKLAYSEVFENYVKLAEEKGLTKEAADSNPRYDSQDLSTIELLYGIKPNGKEDILDLAHPTPVIIAPSHDKVNGLVENLKERQNIIAGIALKQNNGALTQHAYAANELLNEVIKIGFELDKNNDVELMSLADACAEGLIARSEYIQKVAWTWSEIGTGLGLGGTIVGGIAAGLGPVGWGLMAGGLVIYSLLQNFGGMIDQGVNKDCQRAVKELQDIIEENHPDMQHTYGQIHMMIKNISFLQNLSDKATHSNLTPDSATPDKIKEFRDLVEDYKKACNLLAQYIPGYIDVLKSSEALQSGQKDSDFVAVIKTVWDKIYPTEVHDAIVALQTLQESLATSTQTLDKYEASVVDYLEKNKGKIMESAEQLSEKHPDTVQPNKSPADHWHEDSQGPDTTTDLEKKIHSSQKFDNVKLAATLQIDKTKLPISNDHLIGMRVTKGGSCCANCYFGEKHEDGPHCKNGFWVAASKELGGGGGDTKLPAPANEFCCDEWKPAKTIK